MVIAKTPAGDQLAGFLSELMGVLDEAVAVDGLFKGDLGREIRAAWVSVKVGLGGASSRLADSDEDDLAAVGLTGDQLALKMRAWELHRDEWRFQHAAWRENPTDASSLDRLKRVTSRLLGLASSILGSLQSIGALPGVEALRELVDTLETLL
jgi:hypothetical protein